MTYIKRIVMHGFKSFASKTEIPFDKEMNLIVGPNGSGKSNVTDALCFALGRRSIKSIRAAKAANLLFSGNKSHKPSQEAYVELIFDNSDKTFTLDSNEISIKRIVRRNGQSIYKINNETKTRQELLELLMQAGIDPHGFNIVLQGEISSLIQISSEERRKIIEEVAGISIYETRKQKSLKELEKTDERLKEVSAILRERNTYMRNLDKERQEALNHQKLEESIKKCKATIIYKNMKEKEKDISNLNDLIEHQQKAIEKIKKQISEKNSEISSLEEKSNKINKLIQSSTSGEQETLHKEISELKALVAELRVRKENFDARITNNKTKTSTIRQKNSELKEEISEAKSSSPKIKEQRKTQHTLQEKLDKLETDRRKFYQTKSELSTLENQRQTKHNFLIESKKELNLIEKSILESYEEIKYVKSREKSESLIIKTRLEIENHEEHITLLDKQILGLEKSNAGLEQTVSEEEKLKGDLPKLNICPLCKNKITPTHIKNVMAQSNTKIKNAEEKKAENTKQKQLSEEKLSKLKNELDKLNTKLNEIEIDLIKLKNANDKKEHIKKITQSKEHTNAEMGELNSRISSLRKIYETLENIEEDYDEAKLKLQELSFADTDVDTEVSIKQRELNRLNVELKSITRDNEESEVELKRISEGLSKKEKQADEKEKEEKELYEKFQKLFEDKNELQDQQKAIETTAMGLQHETRAHEDKINSMNIQKAQLTAQLDTHKADSREFENIEVLNLPLEKIKERLTNSEYKLARIGSVNMRALDAYDKVREQCAEIEEKVQTIEKEKEQVLKIIEQIDKKKKKSFIKTLDAVNAHFTQNFSQLSRKGTVFLDLENKQDPFDGGLNMIIKVARGKYFDISSLSGGEKTLVALSLIFAIQKYKPYCFYIFDEIDAALDKHNSERLAALVKHYMTSGQYLIITHNDALISEASTLYGVSMQENISKVISLKI